ncbi:multisubunit potassium/proton antiporter PhaG subunit [Azospirillum brasilense]|uniref:Multisubunit potassium/proton antiporter PhaG subunit n=1 Tax=Azospirillum brasilense TaxID=192 RepID=A0A560BYD6_AZOBR|nr:monovalent cation/H(+) antiporter subunit G [Azospirillum brasilense]MBK3734462.1 cation:proton antiporter [Azospirillum brasilense]TWA77624.1 multisubunit potassium/proton antiporter PhaG subunit [Azospirillum brasilense]
MTHLADLPVWAAIPVALLLLLGASLALIGSIGFVRLRSFYERVHAPTLGTTMGIGSVLLASMLCFTVLQSRLVLHEILIAIFMVVTTPITLMLLARAALYRDRSEGSDDVPAAPPAPPVESAAPPAPDAAPPV